MYRWGMRPSHPPPVHPPDMHVPCGNRARWNGQGAIDFPVCPDAPDLNPEAVRVGQECLLEHSESGLRQEGHTVTVDECGGLTAGEAGHAEHLHCVLLDERLEPCMGVGNQQGVGFDGA